MSEMELVLNNTSQQLLSLAKTLNSEFEGKVLDSLLVKKNSTTVKNNKSYNNFSSHPKRLSSDSLLSLTKSVENDFCENLATVHYNEYFNSTIVTPSDSCVSSHTFLRYPKPIIRSPILNSYSDTQTTLINKEVATPRSDNDNVVRAAAIIKSKQNKNALVKPVINGVKSKPSVKKANASNILVKPLIITTTCKTSMPVDMDKKLRMEIQKTLGCLEEIRIAMHDGIPTPDGIEEYQRVSKRTTEFVARFGRNYVYSLERHIADLEKHTICSNKIALRSVMNIHQSLFLAHHSVTNAFQAYRNNMPVCIPSLIIDRLVHVLNKCCVLCEIHKKCLNLEKVGGNNRDEMLDVLQNECRLLLLTIEQFMENAINYQLIKPKLKSPTRFSLRGHPSSRKEQKKRKPKKIPSRLSMYSAPSDSKRVEGSFFKTFETVSKEHHKYGNVQSKYLTAGYKPRISIENSTHDKPPFISVPLKTKCFHKKTPGRWRSTPITTARNEDEIQTIVESQKDNVDISDHDSCSEKSKKSSSSIKEMLSSPEKSSDLLTKQKSFKEATGDYDRGKWNKGKKGHELSPYIYDLCEQVISSENEAMSQQHLEGLLKGLLGMALNEKIDDRESGSKKNGFVDHNNCHVKFVQGQNSQSEKTEKSNKPLRQRDLSKNKVLGEKNIKSARSDESLAERKRKKGVKPFTTVVSATEKSDIISSAKNVEEIQTNNGLLEYVQSCTDKCRKENLDDNVKKKKKIIADESQVNNKNKRRQTVTVTGVKNAQLICIKDEDSIVENNVKGRSTKYDRNNNLTSGKTKGTMDASGKATKAPSKLSRIPKKELKQLAFIPKMEALNVIQYKLQYSEYIKGNPMYRKSSSRQPWVIVNSLSECLLNNILLSIAQEIQIDDVLKKLYESEFQ